MAPQPHTRSTCDHRVERGSIAYPCSRPAGHERTGEPHYATEVPSSVRAWENWAQTPPPSIVHIDQGSAATTERGVPTKQRVGDQALPSGGGACVQDLVIAEMEESKRVGLERYGSVLRTFNGRKGWQDVAEEARDLHVYATMLAEEARATRATLVQQVFEAIQAEGVPVEDDDEAWHSHLAEVAVDRIMGWVLGNLDAVSVQDGAALAVVGRLWLDSVGDDQVPNLPRDYVHRVERAVQRWDRRVHEQYPEEQRRVG